MKILLKEDVSGLGYCGDEVTVKDGYARNFLIPQGKALRATPKNIKQFNHQKMIVQGKLKKILSAASAQADRIGQVTCVITKKVGEQGKLYGSVTAQEICSRLQDQGVEVDRRKIQLSEPIKALGEFQVPVKLHAEVMAQIKVKVVPEEAPEKKEEAQPESDAPADAAAEATGKTPETEQTEKESS